MNWSIIVGPLLKAKLAMVVLLGQLLIYYFVFAHVKEHHERIIELVLASIILWVGYIAAVVSQYFNFNQKLQDQEAEYDKMYAAEAMRHEKAEKILKDHIIALETLAKGNS